MQTYYKYPLIVAFWLGWLVPLWAQVPIYLGKSADVVANYKAKADEKARNPKTVNNKINHSIPGEAQLVLNINISKKQDTINLFIGAVDKKKGSTFFLSTAPINKFIVS